ncbi:hypothetical protein TA3x_005135 [Tundrisphaera sp. TA3]|uniref:hypothetical protein n=1 Tax=Tundrisphaera sp. TA3 TaxID=3435775 RepID=UPI003EBBAC2D
MPWRNRWLVRAFAAAGLMSGPMLGASTAGEPREPVPGAGAESRTVKVLEAEKAGELAVEVRGHGQDRVRVGLRNTSGRRLNVILPPGLVASNAVGQGAFGGGGAQNMGLGAAINNAAGGFGQFAGQGQGQNQGQDVGFRSVAPSPAAESAPSVTVPAGQEVSLEIPAVCLNFGKPTPTLRDRFRLVDVDDYSQDVRVRKALRALATYGTSHGTAQAAMWRICNDVPFDLMVAKGDKIVNPAEVALAARFVDAVDRSGDRLDPAYLSEARVFVSISGEGPMAKDAKRLAAEIDGLRVLGLASRVVDRAEAPRASGPALFLDVKLTAGATGATRGVVAVRSSNGLGEAGWQPLGDVELREGASVSALDGSTLARSIDRAVGSAFVTAKATRKSTGSTTLRVENRLPFTLAGISVKAGQSAGAPVVNLPGLGIGPGRSGLATIEASRATVEAVELNGL